MKVKSFHKVEGSFLPLPLEEAQIHLLLNATSPALIRFTG